MTLRQKILRLVYPLLMKWDPSPKRKGWTQKPPSSPERSIYGQQVILNDGQSMDFSGLKGRKILLVNTASDCGFTAQYAELQQLYEAYRDRLMILGFPSNDFKQQEKGSDAEIARFCQVNYGLSFPLAKKSVVIKSPDQHPVYRWLSRKEENGWNEEAPNWNFTKYLLNEEGVLTHVFRSSVSPLDPEITKIIQS
ncbi:MAG: glutathione peroxidase [Flavisolibacter sp.]